MRTHNKPFQSFVIRSFGFDSSFVIRHSNFQHVGGQQPDPLAGKSTFRTSNLIPLLKIRTSRQKNLIPLLKNRKNPPPPPPPAGYWLPTTGY